MLFPARTHVPTKHLNVFLAFTLLAAGSALALESVPKAEYRQRRIALSEKLQGGAALVFAAEEISPDFLPFRQDADFYYLSGWNEPGAALLVIGPGPATTTRLGTLVPVHAYREILFLPARNLVTEKYTGIKMDAATPGVAGATGFDAVMPMTALPEVLTGRRWTFRPQRERWHSWPRPSAQPHRFPIKISARSPGTCGPSRVLPRSNSSAKPRTPP
jgi:Xaa-Pro aminopeptidase